MNSYPKSIVFYFFPVNLCVFFEKFKWMNRKAVFHFILVFFWHLNWNEWMTVALFRERKTLLESLKKNMHFLLKKWDIYSDLDWMAHVLFLKKKYFFFFDSFCVYWKNKKNIIFDLNEWMAIDLFYEKKLSTVPLMNINCNLYYWPCYYKRNQ